MGAVFGLFAGFYYWIGKITGYAYPEWLGKVHFWVLFVGVNLTFFPQHFLGLAGFPRRYSDFADGYSYYNYVSSIGSIISVIAVIVFVIVIYRTLTDKVVVGAQQWKEGEFFEYAGENKESDTLEWVNMSPPAMHTYNELPYIVSEAKEKTNGNKRIYSNSGGNISDNMCSIVCVSGAEARNREVSGIWVWVCSVYGFKTKVWGKILFSGNIVYNIWSRNIIIISMRDGSECGEL